MAAAAPAAGVAAAAEVAVAALEAATLGALLTYIVLKGIQLGYRHTLGALLTVLAAGMRAVRIHRRWLHVDPLKGLANKVDDLNHAIHNDLGRAAAAAENAAIYTFHAAGALQAWTTAEIAALSGDVLRAIEGIYNHAIPSIERDIHDWVNHRLHGIDRAVHGLRAWVETMITRRIHGLEKLFQHRLNVFGRGIDRTITRVKTDFSKSIARLRADIANIRGITARQARRIAALERAIAALGGATLAGIRARVGRLEREVAGIKAGTAAKVGVGAVAAALTALGLGWLRCRNVTSVGKRVCGLDPSMIEEILADTLLIAGTLSLVEFAETMVGVTDEASGLITKFWRAT